MHIYNERRTAVTTFQKHPLMETRGYINIRATSVFWRGQTKTNPPSKLVPGIRVFELASPCPSSLCPETQHAGSQQRQHVLRPQHTTIINTPPVSSSPAPCPRAFPTQPNSALPLLQSRLRPHRPLASHRPSQSHPLTHLKVWPQPDLVSLLLTKAKTKGVLIECLLWADQHVKLQAEFSREPYHGFSRSFYRWQNWVTRRPKQAARQWQNWTWTQIWLPPNIVIHYTRLAHEWATGSEDYIFFGLTAAEKASAQLLGSLAPGLLWNPTINWAIFTVQNKGLWEPHRASTLSSVVANLELSSFRVIFNIFSCHANDRKLASAWFHETLSHYLILPLTVKYFVALKVVYEKY